MNAYNPGPVNRITRWLSTIAVLVVIAACILALGDLWTYQIASVCHDGNCPGGGVPQVTPYGAGGATPTGPIAVPEPAGITAGPDGALWFTDASENRIGRITTSGQVREFLLPAIYGDPQSITMGPDGALWFTAGNQIGRITTSGQVREFRLTADSERWITAGPDGALWFTDEQGNQIGRITTSGQVREFPLPPL